MVCHKETKNARHEHVVSLDFREGRTRHAAVDGDNRRERAHDEREERGDVEEDCGYLSHQSKVPKSIATTR